MNAKIKVDPVNVAHFLTGKRVKITLIDSLPQEIYERRIVYVYIFPQSEFSFATLVCHLDSPFEGRDLFSCIEIFVEPRAATMTAEQQARGGVLFVEPKGYQQISGHHYSRTREDNVVLKVV